MQLKPLDSPQLLQLAIGWLSQKENYQWLDFGDGRQQVSAEWLKIAMQRGTLFLRMITADLDDVPIGVVGLSNVNKNFKTANFLIVIGERAYAKQGYATRAGLDMLTLGFRDLGLHSIHTWIVDGNHSVRLARNMHFKPIGRQRQCHFIDGQAYDRLWFDVLAAEHQETSDVRHQHIA
jgi:RimJ/RimL family protein N-acetyltransferase